MCQDYYTSLRILHSVTLQQGCLLKKIRVDIGVKCGVINNTKKDPQAHSSIPLMQICEEQRAKFVEQQVGLLPIVAEAMEVWALLPVFHRGEPPRVSDKLKSLDCTVFF